ncbi:MAG TPA: glycosyltransferase family 1 protein [Gaiellaceae bacterium]|nr:glycosyltransferase family 1 protein [Gaiellaceae bacterium]
MPSRPTIAIPLLTLVPGELGGSETYVRELLASLADVGEHEYRVVLPPVAPAAGGALPSTIARGYRTARTMRERLAAMSLATVRPGPLRASLGGVDAVHFPLTIELPRTSLPTAVTLHDVQHLDRPELFSRAERAFRAVAWHRSARRADLVIAISEFVRERAVERLGLNAERMRVVPQGIDHARFTPGHTAREPFLLYPARGWQHKNHARLFEAFALLRREQPELRLVLTGGDFERLPDGVESRGHVSIDELVSLLHRASALVFPSLYEGFGLPPLEAMACGCPVACSNAAALPETVGDAALLFDPTDVESIAAAIRDVLDDPQPWVERGLARAALFSWDVTARATDSVYAELSTRA